MQRTRLLDLITRFHRFCMEQYVFTLLLAILIGVLSGYGALLFLHLMNGVQALLYGQGGDIMDFVHRIPPWQLLAIPTAGGLGVGLLVHYGAREAKGHGVPEVMAALALKEGRIRKRVAVVKILASALCIGSGGSTGREGPMVQIGCAIGSAVGQVARVPLLKQKTLVGCGAAAGIAATFNAPIAGVLFALEVLIGDYGVTTFSPVVLASVTATVISRHHLGDFPLFTLPPYRMASLWEFGLYPFLGIAAGLAAVLFIVVLYASEDFFDSIPIPDWIKPALGGLGLGILLLWFPQVFGVGYGSMNLVLRDGMAGWLMLGLVGLKVLATSLSIGSGGSGGIFAPSLFIGAMTGGAFGALVGHLFPGITASPGVYALVGMGAVVAGATHAPITAILIIFEMTGEYKVILPMMITCILATIVASALKNGSIYTIKLMRQGVDISQGMEQNILRALKVAQFMSHDSVTVSESLPLCDVIDTFKNRDASYLHVTNPDGRLTGIISFRDIRGLLDEECPRTLIIAQDVATTHLVTLLPGDTLFSALRRFGKWGVSQLPVVEPGSGRLLGTLREKDLLAAYDKAVVRHELGAL
jgi:CIC family chloride channel protein